MRSIKWPNTVVGLASPRVHPRVSRIVERIDGFWTAALVLALGAAVLVESINLGLIQSGDLDEGVYLSVARLLNRGYPHWAIDFDQFALFPQILALAFRLAGDSLITARLTILSFSVLGLLALGLLTRVLGWRGAGLLATLFALTNSYYLSRSRYTLGEIPGLALTLCALIAVAIYTQPGARASRAWLALGALAFAAGLLIKPLTIGFALTIGWWLIARALAHSEKERAARWRELAFDTLIFGAVGVLVALPFFNWFDLGQEFQRTAGFHLQETSVFAPLMRERRNALISFVAENRMWLGLALFGAIAAARKAPGRVLPLLASELISVALLLQLPPFLHHYVILTPLLALFAAVGVEEGIALLRPRVSNRATLSAQARALTRLLMPIAFLAAAALWLHDAPQLARYDYPVLYRTWNDPSPAVDLIEKHTAPGAFLISDDPLLVYLSGRLIPPSAILLSYDTTFDLLPDGEQRLARCTRDYDVKAIIVTGPYKRHSDLMQWIERQYPIVRDAGEGPRQVFARMYSRE